jgi:uncharacterized membrane protein
VAQRRPTAAGTAGDAAPAGGATAAGSTPSTGSGARVGGRSAVCAGGLIGVGVAGFVDETVFHQILHWHHFWDGGTPGAALVSDGLFHAGSWLALVAGGFWLAELRRRGTAGTRAWVAGILGGAGAFQLYDGTVQHKLLGLHQIRYHVTIWPYDLVWDLAAVAALLAAAALLWRRPRPGR